jgi:hypothetical protein
MDVSLYVCKGACANRSKIDKRVLYAGHITYGILFLLMENMHVCLHHQLKCREMYHIINMSGFYLGFLVWEGGKL